MKRFTALILCVLMLAFSFAGCSANNNKTQGEVKVIATIFPIYDWAREIAGDNSDIGLELLLDNGVDMHSFQPTAKDVIDISDCDIFIYVGGESDSWVKDVLAQAKNKDMIVLSLIDILGEKAKEEELKEGMQGDDDDSALDEHVWLSLKNASLFTDKIAEAFSKADAEHSDLFKSNADNYKKELSRLDEDYQAAVNAGKTKTLLFGDRFPFRYMTDDYGLDYYAAFSGCSAEVEASFETITYLSNKLDELDLRAVMKIETSDGAIAAAIRDNTRSKDQEILTLDSLQGVTSERINAGETYLSIMKANLEVLKKALG